MSFEPVETFEGPVLATKGQPDRPLSLFPENDCRLHVQLRSGWAGIFLTCMIRFFCTARGNEAESYLLQADGFRCNLGQGRADR
jgi:hypothetical protein